MAKASKKLEQVRRQRPARAQRPEGEHADRTARAVERHVQALRAGHRVGPQAGGAAEVEDPVRHAALAGVHRKGGLVSGPDHEPAVLVRHQGGDLALQDLRHVAHDDVEQLGRAPVAGELAAHRVERGGAALALAGVLGLHVQLRSQRADDQGHREHHGERHEVLDVRDREVEIDLDEKEVEGHDAQDGTENGRAEPDAHGDERDAQQIDHRDVRRVEPLAHDPGQEGAGEHRPRRPRVAFPFDGRFDRRRARDLGRLLFALDDVDVNVAAGADQVAYERAEEPVVDAERSGLAGDDFGDVVLAREVDDLCHHVHAGQPHGLGAELLGQGEVLRERLLFGVGEGRRLDSDGDPFGVQSGGHPPRRPHKLGGERTGTDADEEPLGGPPDAGDRLLFTVTAHLQVDAVGGRAQRQLAQRDEVALAEKIIGREPRLLGKVDLSLFQALDQVVGRQVNQLDFVGLLDDGVGDCLADDDVGDLLNDVVEAFEVLHVERRVHIDAGIEEIGGVLPSLGVAAAGRVRVRQFVHEDESRLARQRRFEVELAQLRAAVFHEARRQNFESLEERLGLGAPMGFDDPDDDVQPLGLARLGRLEHGVGLADAGRRAEEDFQLPAPLPLLLRLDLLEQFVGISAGRVHRLLTKPLPPKGGRFGRD